MCAYFYLDGITHKEISAARPPYPRIVFSSRVAAPLPLGSSISSISSCRVAAPSRPEAAPAVTSTAAALPAAAAAAVAAAPAATTAPGVDSDIQLLTNRDYQNNI